MAFLTKSELKDAIHIEIVEAITREDDTIIETIIDATIGEMKGYLSSRYDVETIFNQTGSNRHPVIMMYAKDIVVYHLHSIHNPDKIPDIRVDRYKRTMEWLKQVQKGTINPDLPTVEHEGSPYVKYGSNTKRQNHF